MEGKLPSSNRRKEYLPRTFSGGVVAGGMLGFMLYKAAMSVALCSSASQTESSFPSPPEGQMNRLLLPWTLAPGPIQRTIMQKRMSKCNHNTEFELTWPFGFFMLLCHSVSADGKVIVCNWFFWPW